MGAEKLTSLVATDTGNLMLFENATLRWAAQLPFVPLEITRGTFQQNYDDTNLLNFLVLMSSEGDLFVGESEAICFCRSTFLSKQVEDPSFQFYMQ